MKYILTLLTLAFSSPAFSIPLETWQSFASDHPNEANRTQSCAMIARGSGTDSLYWVEVDPTTGKLPVDATFSFSDTDFGATTNSQRVSAVVGNTTGQAAFGTGTRSAQTLRVTLATDDSLAVTATDLDVRDLSQATDSVAVGDGTNTIAVSAAGEVSVTATDLDVRDLNQATDSIAVGDGTDTIAVSSAGEVSVTLTTPLPAGTNNIGDVDVTNLPATVDTNSGAAGSSTLRSVLANRHEAAATPISVRISDGSAFQDVKQGRSKVELIRNDHTSTAVTTGAYTELVASTSGVINRLQIFDSSGEALILATGAAASEVDQLYIPPGGFDYPVELTISSGTRLSVKALTAATSSGDLIITALD